uniref:Venom peptide n=1 Tax=Dasymutilla chiron TaxID=374949 RepID=A0A8T9VPZ9_DASCH|nr:venom peptide precursor [Dasymutilla chiron]
MNLGILSYAFMVIVIMAFFNIAESSAEALFIPRNVICKIRPYLSICKG